MLPTWSTAASARMPAAGAPRCAAGSSPRRRWRDVRVLIALAAFLAAPVTVRAQPMHHGQGGAMPDDSKEHAAMPSMPTPLDIPETRDASGTSWQPDVTPMFMWHAMLGGWSLGAHANVFAGYTGGSSERGESLLTSINWVMAMARHSIGAGDLTLRTMLSAEPGTMPGDGYPLLLQTGESFDGEPLHDRQHPHDLFMEVAARLRYPLGDSFGVELYGGPAGEPAIGPTAFPHRFTALADPLAPLGHHWFDSTHITFGVITAGLFTRSAKLEASAFNGREPDDSRWDFDLRPFDSVSTRVTVNPTREVSAQASWARLDSPEEMEPDVSVQRFSGSITWARADAARAIAVLAAIGRNAPSRGPSTTAGMIEGTWFAADTHTVFARAELLTKTGKDLALPSMMDDRVFGLASVSAGYVYDFSEADAVVPGIGVVGTLGVIGPELEPFYGTRVPVGAMLFVRLRPPAMKMKSE